MHEMKQHTQQLVRRRWGEMELLTTPQMAKTIKQVKTAQIGVSASQSGEEEEEKEEECEAFTPQHPPHTHIHHTHSHAHAHSLSLLSLLSLISSHILASHGESGRSTLTFTRGPCGKRVLTILPPAYFAFELDIGNVSCSQTSGDGRCP